MSYTSNAFIDVAEIPFSREKVPQYGLKINGSVKTRDIGLVWEFLAPDNAFLIKIKT